MANGDETKNTDNEIKIGDELEEIQLEQVIDATTIPPTEEGEEDAPPTEEGEEDAPPTEEGEEDAPPTEVVAKKVKKYKKNVIVDIFHNSMITKKVSVPIHNVGKNIRETLETIIASEIEGKCIAEGFVKEKSTRIMTYSCGLVSSNNILFDVVFECMICLPVEGMHITCVAKNITKAGIRAETEDIPSPVVIFVARDHHATMNKYGKVTVGRNIKVRVIGQRFELNDKYISIIAELIDSNVSDNMGLKKKPKKLVFNK
jgi:DNA-directed RNA polymerase subunit E'/Rpb7